MEQWPQSVTEPLQLGVGPWRIRYSLYLSDGVPGVLFLGTAALELLLRQGQSPLAIQGDLAIPFGLVLLLSPAVGLLVNLIGLCCFDKLMNCKGWQSFVLWLLRWESVRDLEEKARQLIKRPRVAEISQPGFNAQQLLDEKKVQPRSWILRVGSTWLASNRPGDFESKERTRALTTLSRSLVLYFVGLACTGKVLFAQPWWPNVILFLAAAAVSLVLATAAGLYMEEQVFELFDFGLALRDTGKQPVEAHAVVQAVLTPKELAGAAAGEIGP